MHEICDKRKSPPLKLHYKRVRLKFAKGHPKWIIEWRRLCGPMRLKIIVWDQMIEHTCRKIKGRV